MNGLLNDLMHDRADALPAPDLDVDAMVRDGQRRVTRRRTALVGGGAAAAVLAALALPQLLPTAAPPKATDTFASALASHQPAYALGTSLHVDGLTVEVPTAPKAMVQTDRGVVYADDAGVVWSTTSDGTLEVGTTDRRSPHLVTDGPRAGWVDTAGDLPVFAVLDQTTGGVTSSPLRNVASTGTQRNQAGSAVVYALDGDVLYVRDPRGVVAWNHRTDDQRVLGDADRFDIDDVQDGRIAYQPREMGGTAQPYRVGPDLTTGRQLEAWTGFALSPSATYLLGEDDPDRAKVFDVATGEVIDAVPDGYAFFAGYAWLDDDTYVGIGLNKPWETTPVDMLTCDVGGACTVAADAIGTIDGGVVLPLGEAE